MTVQQLRSAMIFIRADFVPSRRLKNSWTIFETLSERVEDASHLNNHLHRATVRGSS
jgi:hypothetical protein